MATLLDDIQILLTKIENKYNRETLKKYLKENQNLISSNSISYVDIKSRRIKLLESQKEFNEKVEKEIGLLNSIGIQFIGLKGMFLEKTYYSGIHRASGDIDILVKSEDAGEFYKGLKRLGYKIELKTMYDNPVLNMKFIPKKYMDNTQTLMLINKKRNISIDMHSNLNITNAHFVKSDTKFDANQFFKNSINFESYNNIKQLEPHDNLCFLFRHLMKHHIFYGKVQTGLSTPIQLVLDIAFIINSESFDEEKLFAKIFEYNLLPEAIYCLNLYNKIFVNSGISINLKPLIEKFKRQNSSIKWKPILDVSLDMDIESIMIGDFSETFPKLYNIVSKCEELNPIIDYIAQAFIINPFVKNLL